MATRRDFIGGLLGLTTGTATVEDLPPDVGKLVSIFGAETVCRHVGEMLARDEEITLVSLRQSLRREQRRTRKAKAASERRMRHQDVVLYRGPVRQAIDNVIDGLKPVRSGVTRKTLLVGVAPERLVLYSPVGDQLRWLIPAGSRMLVDARRDLSEIVQAELVDTGRDGFPLRLHLWSQSTEWTGDSDTLPILTSELVAYTWRRSDPSPWEDIQDRLEGTR